LQNSSNTAQLQHGTTKGQRPSLGPYISPHPSYGLIDDTP